MSDNQPIHQTDSRSSSISAGALSSDKSLRPASARGVHLLPLSATSLGELKLSASRYMRWLDSASGGVDVADVCFSAAASLGRSRGHRLAVLGKTHAELATKLRQWAAGQPCAGVWQGRCEGMVPPRISFLFSGQGSQYRNMARDLWETQPVFRAVIEQCDEALRTRMTISLVDLVFGSAAPEDQLHQTQHTQPVIFAFGYALARTWESWGVAPAYVLGHSIGELAAACFAGVMPLNEALEFVVLRGRLIQESTATGTMAAIVAPPQSVEPVLKELGGQVEIAAINGPENVVISGDKADVQRVMEHFKAQDIPALVLRISHAVHSPLMDPILNDYTAAVSRISLSRPRTPIISNLSGRVAGAEITQPEYWRRQLRHTVNFRACLEALRDEGCQVALETGGTSILTSLGPQCLPNSSQIWLHSLGLKNSMFNMRPQKIAGRNDWETVLETLGQLYALGVNLNWEQIQNGFCWRTVTVP